MCVTIELDLPEDLSRFKLPAGVGRRLDQLLDKQDAGTALTPDERLEAEGLVNLAELFSVLRLRAERHAAMPREAIYREMLMARSPEERWIGR